MSIMPDSTIRKNPCGLRDSTVSAAADLLGEIGLIGKSLDGAALEELAVERAVHVAGVEQAEQLGRGCGFGGRVFNSAVVASADIAGLAKLRDEIDLVCTRFEPGAPFGQKIGRTAAQDDLGLGRKECSTIRS